MMTVEHAEVRAALLEHGRKCRLCSVIVQPVAGSINDAIRAHKVIVHRINGSTGERNNGGEAIAGERK